MASATAYPVRAGYPVRVDASLDLPLSRWLWVVKWLLVLPHYLVLAVLWLAFALLSVVAFFGILFTGRYPRSIFEFNVGVLRWSWRVAHYTYGALGTDKYPPFTLAEVPDYPAHFDVTYPQHLSRGLVLVKWWLLALPHYLIVGFFLGGGSWLAVRGESAGWGWSGGLIGILVLVAGVVLAVTGRYPRPIYDFVLGMNRWVLRVAAYAALMTDQYPPFRLDTGGSEPGSTLTPPQTPPTDAGSALPPRPVSGSGAVGWTAPRIVTVVVGALLAVTASGLLFGGGAALWADRVQRDGGYVTSPTATLDTSGYALTSTVIDVHIDGVAFARSILGDARVRVTSADPAKAVFVGIAPQAAAEGYLSGVHYATVTDLSRRITYRDHQGSAPATSPASAGIWAERVSGVGTQALIWPVQSGRWTIVAMNADASPGVSVRTDIGATAPSLAPLAAGLLIGGGLLLAGSVMLILLPVRRASR